MKSQVYFSIIDEREKLEKLLNQFDELFLQNTIESSTIRRFGDKYILRFANNDIEWNSSKEYTLQFETLWIECEIKKLDARYLEIYDEEYYTRYIGNAKKNGMPPNIAISMAIK